MKYRYLVAALTVMTIAGCSTKPAVEADVQEQVVVVNSIAGLYMPSPSEAVIYYKRADDKYADWGLHLWSGDVAKATTWFEAFPLTGISEKYGAYYVVPLKGNDWAKFKFIVHKGNAKDLGGLDHDYSRVKFGQDVFTTEGSTVLLADPVN